MNVQDDPNSWAFEKFGVGQPVPRTEDPTLVQGRGRYADDVSLKGQAYAAIVRSSHAHGVIKGIDTAAALLVAAGDNPDRLHSEAAWAHLCGVSPLEASSGKVTRHRLNRGGDRQANRALWHIVITRLASDPRTQAYMERRVKDGRSKSEAIRMLKRYVAREVYRYLPRV
jgi:transposase